MPRAGPLRYWSLTLLGLLVMLGSLAAEAWGILNLIGTESCGTRTTEACSSETGLHILASVVAPFVGLGGVVVWALRGGGTRTWLSRLRPGPRRRADRIARGEEPMPAVGRPAPSPPVPSQTPLNRTWPPATWKPDFLKPSAPARTPVERLQALNDLKARGLITPADFEAQKKRILGGI